MNRFERASERGAWTQKDNDHRFPEDFSEEEVEFARELREVFSSEEEELPPHYVTTLFENERHAGASPGFEQKMAYQVLNRLDLPRAPLFPRDRGVWPWAAIQESLTYASRSMMGVIGAVMLVMILSVVVASPSFAAGLRILTGHAGVEQVQSYPQHVATSPTATPGLRNHAIPTRRLETAEWLGPSVDHYDYEGIYLSTTQEWSDGPVVELQYFHQGDTQGSGLLDVREFRPSTAYASVLQVVEEGSATQVTVGNLPGVYVNGRWVHYGKHSDWQMGVKSELIFERDGLIFWVVADQRDGTGQEQLIDIAQHLTPIAMARLMPNRSSLLVIGRLLEGSLQGPVAGEVLALIPAGSSPDSGMADLVSLAGGLSGDG